MLIKTILLPKSRSEKLFSGFFLYSLLSFFIAIQGFHAFRQLEDTELAVSRIDQLYHLTLNTTHFGEQFLAYETTNEQFFSEGSSETLNLQYIHLKQLRELSQDMLNSDGKWKLIYQNELNALDSLLNVYDRTFRRTISSIKYKGYKDQGLVGYMGRQARELEKSPSIKKEYLLQIRRHEKNYMIEGDTSHLYAARRVSRLIQQDLLLSNTGEGEKRRLQDYLRRYNSSFLKIAEEDMKIGYTGSGGLIAKLASTTRQVSQLVTNIHTDAQQRKTDLYNRSQMAVIVTTTLSVILLLTLSLSFDYILQQR